MRSHTRLLILLLATVGLGFTMAGCGGSGSRSGSATGALTISVAWPEPTASSSVRPALIPQRSGSIKVEFLREEQVVKEGLIVRPETSKTFDQLPAMELLLRATAHPNADGTGTAQAKAEKPITIEVNQNIQASLVLASTIVTVEVTPNPAQVEVGGTVQLTPTCEDASGATVLVPASGAFTWEVIEGSAYASVDTDGLVTGLDEGMATIEATEQESKMSGIGSVIVSDQPGPRDIVFVSTRESEPTWAGSEIYVMNFDGSGQKRLTNTTAHNYSPAWSPDGSKIAFVSDRDDDDTELYVMNADGSGQRRLTMNYLSESRPTWSPDGSQIYFSASRYGGTTTHIYVMNCDGSEVTRLPNTEHGFRAHPSPLGNKIAFTHFSSYRYDWDIYVMNIDGSGRANLTNCGADDDDAAWSADGTKIAFDSWRDGNWELYVMNTDGSDVVRLTDFDGRDKSPAWSPDGAKIIFTRTKGSSAQIYSMNADGSEPRNLSCNSYQDFSPDWRPH